MAQESISRGIDNYLEKINCLLACLNSEEWIVSANIHSVETLYNTALEIEECMSKAEAQKILESLKIVFPEHNFTRCGDLVLETILVHPQTPEEPLAFAVDKYIRLYSSNCLCNLLFRLMQGKKLKDQAMTVIKNYGDGTLLQKFEAFCCMKVCEKMILDKDANFENYVKDLLETKTPLCNNILAICSKETGRVILEVILKFLNEDKEFKLWFIMLNQQNIKVTSFLCAQYPELMSALLKFFENYAAEAEFQQGKPFSWSHKLAPLHAFIEILNYLLSNDGLVGITINDFLIRKITDLKSDCSFWLDVKALL